MLIIYPLSIISLAEIEQKIKRRNFKTAKPEWHRYQPGKNVNLNAIDHDSRDYKLARLHQRQRTYRLAMYLTIEGLSVENESTPEIREEDC